ncbi:MAG: hypothetical protein JWO51_1382 [Rhodospirillales bacterium]|nr:hypothetical protein [Rhodospirillales bacterium]
MTEKTISLFIDTNGFIQMRDAKDLPWNEIFKDAARIDLMISPRVIEELDKFKVNTNKRKRDRSRAALKIIDSASQNDDMALTVRTSSPEVRVVIAQNPAFDWSRYPNLDQSKPDDHLVAEAIAFGANAAIFSHDSGPRIRARIARIAAHKPPDNWLLPDETSDDQKKISQLERQLEKALSTSPSIVVAINGLIAPGGSLVFEIPIVQALDPSDANNLATKYLYAHRRGSQVGSTDPMGRGGFLPTAEVERYNKEYDRFEKLVPQYFNNLHIIVAHSARAMKIQYSVGNNSGVSAKGLRIDVDVEGEISLISESREADMADDATVLPIPPKPPRSLMEMIGGSHGSFLNVSSLHDHSQPRDPVEFYWFNRPEIGSKLSSLQCEDFRATRQHGDEIFVVLNGSLPASANVNIQVSATNLPAPVSASAAISIVQRRTDWTDETILTLLPDFIRGEISQYFSSEPWQLTCLRREGATYYDNGERFHEVDSADLSQLTQR